MKIALSLSGGGYRAATYHLGTLSYLNHLHLKDGSPLLDHVSAVSTISGGTLTGLWLILSKARGWSNHEMLKRLYQILMEGDVIGHASRSFFSAKNPNESLIREMVKIYNEDIFEGATLGDLMDKMDAISIDDFSANATEFTRAIEFRFQVGKKVKTDKNGVSRGLIGNAKYSLPDAVAREILLAEVFAASSCFPGGFEPLFFPRDFQVSQKPECAELLAKKPEVALMDGGVVDNQGIEPINLIRDRRDIDLYVISDAGCGKDVNYAFEPTNVLSGLTIHKTNVCLNIAILLLASFLLWVPQSFWFGLCTGLTAVALAARVSTALISRKLLKKYSKKIPFDFNWKWLLKIPFSKYINILLSRATSMLTLTDDVFMKHIRSLNYDTIYEDPRWENRRIMNALYELGTGQNWTKHLKPTKDDKDEIIIKVKEQRVQQMTPSEKIIINSDNSTSMATTLWWSDADRKLGKPESLIAAGQYNICWNLLEYIYRLPLDKNNLNEHHELLIELQHQLEEDWTKFKDNPHWMLDELKL